MGSLGFPYEVGQVEILGPFIILDRLATRGSDFSGRDDAVLLGCNSHTTWRGAFRA